MIATLSFTLIEPERYFRDPNVSYVEDAMYVCMESDVPRARLMLDGYDPNQVDKLTPDYRYRGHDEDSARKAHDGTYQKVKQYNRSGVHEIVTMYRTWTWIDEASSMITRTRLPKR